MRGMQLCELRNEWEATNGDRKDSSFQEYDCSIEVREEGSGKNGSRGIDLCDKILIGLLSVYPNFCVAFLIP